MYRTSYSTKSIARHPVPLKPEVLVLGGGLVGIAVSRELARGGMQVVIAEKGESLGGGARGCASSLTGAAILGSVWAR